MNHRIRARSAGAVISLTIAAFSLFSCAASGARDNRRYPNGLASIGVTDAEIDARIGEAVSKLFRGNDDERIYYETDDGMAYILDVLHNDVRSEGMSYGMMLCAQLGMKDEFDRLWRFSRERMLHKTGDYRGYFAWQLARDGTVLDKNPAPDGEEYFAAALFMASARWGDGEGILDYRTHANAILDQMLRHRELTGLAPNSWISDMFDRDRNQVVFVPLGNASHYTDPSYHVPHFYELFALRAARDNERWRAIAAESRKLFKKACHPGTGLAPDYADFDGFPVRNGTHYRFENDAWRVGANVALDSLWWDRDPWARKEFAKRYLGFFRRQGLGTYPCRYDVDGTNPAGGHAPGLVAMNAVVSLVGSERDRKDFIGEFWNLPVPSGTGRYFDGCLYLFALLEVSGRYRIFEQRSGK